MSLMAALIVEVVKMDNPNVLEAKDKDLTHRLSKSRKVERRQELECIASETLNRFVKLPFEQLLHLASQKGHAEVREVGSYTSTVDVLFDYPKRKDAVRIIVVVNRNSLFSFMFPKCESAMVVRGQESTQDSETFKS